MKILLLDIETAPNLAYVWGLWEQNIGTNQIVDSGYVLCWAAKWLGEDKMHFDSIKKSGAKKMLKGIRELINEADVIVHYNGTKFDIPTLNKEFLLHGMPPPAPYKQVDLLRVSRQQFRFQSHKLDYVAKSLGFSGKAKHAGFQLWVDCMANKPEAWRKMEEYNKQDVTELEKVYMRFRPWIKNHPNHNVYDHVVGCPACGGEKFQRRGVAVAQNVTYHRYQCTSQGCGKWFRGGKMDKPKAKYREIA